MAFNFLKKKSNEPKLRNIEELINLESTTWNDIVEAVNESQHGAKILPTTKEAGEYNLYRIQVTTNSPLGAISYHCGGIIVDNGWLRILGAGTTELPSVAGANNLSVTPEHPPGSIICAYDVLGGMFVIEGGAHGFNPGEILYSEPETGELFGLEMPYSQFLFWAIDGENLQQFYETFRWSTWVEETKDLNLNKAFSFFPPLSTVEGQNVEKSFRKGVPVVELLGSTFS